MIKFNYKLAGGIGSFGETKNFYKGNQRAYHTKWPSRWFPFFYGEMK
jgi:hypothetical protein